MTSSKFRIDKSGTGRSSGSELAALKRWAADDNAKETCLTFSLSGVKGGRGKKEGNCLLFFFFFPRDYHFILLDAVVIASKRRGGCKTEPDGVVDNDAPRNPQKIRKCTDFDFISTLLAFWVILESKD